MIGRLMRDRIPLRGCVYDTSDPCVDATVKAMLFFRGYESAEIRFVQKYLRRDLDVVELGASLGVVSSQIAKRIGSGRRLVSVEANAALLPTLRRNVAQNAPHVSVTIVNAALHYDGPEVSLSLGPTNLDAHVAAGAHANAIMAVRAVTLASLVAEHGIDRYALVSDVEGAEAAIFVNEGAALERCEQVIVELHEVLYREVSYSVDALLELAREKHGFDVVDRYGPVCVLSRRRR